MPQGKSTTFGMESGLLKVRREAAQALWVLTDGLLLSVSVMITTRWTLSLAELLQAWQLHLVVL